MNTKTTEPTKASEFELLDEAVSDAEMERFLAANHDEIAAKLEEARVAKAEGRYAPLEPLHQFLGRARERFEKAKAR
jgi:hypothetical protein